MSNVGVQIEEAASHLVSHDAALGEDPRRIGIVLGSGLGGLIAHIENATAIPYSQIPHFPQSTAIGHAGQLVFGRLEGRAVVAMQGRFHQYEGYSAQQVAFPIRVMHRLGVRDLILSNVSGGLRPDLLPGELMMIEDHINLQWANPLIGPNDDALGPRFPDMSSPYDQELIQHGQSIARAAGFNVHQGVYAAVTGPNYETRAEMRCIRKLGADVVGMSTVAEVLTAAHAGMRVFAISVVTNACRPDQPGTTDGQSVVETAQSTEPRMRAMVGGIVRCMVPA